VIVFVFASLVLGDPYPLLFAGGRGAPKTSAKPPEAKPPDFKKAPSFRLRDLQGKEVVLEDYAGKVILVDFWASWCPPCIEEAPHLIKLYRQYRDKGFVILGIAVVDSPRAVKGFVQEMGVDYPILFGDESILESYKGVYFLPTAFLIDRSGFIRERLVGYKGEGTLEQKILSLLDAS